MRFRPWMPLVAAALLIVLGSFYIVREGQAALVLNLGRVCLLYTSPSPRD